ncbi:MAG: AsmA-like C-terminal region-containing protein [Rhodospirillales bacterium]|nr:AsmA-like C-terminal region-containing protein [Rhodospirillales bacterium]
MFLRTFRGLIQILGALGAGLAILLLLLVWRLSAGPVSLAFLSPYVERALQASQQSVRIKLDDTILIWAGWDRTFDIRVVNVRAIDPGGAVIAGVPELAFSISGRALLRGVVAPSNVELFGPSLRLVRHRDGRLRFGFEQGTEVLEALLRGGLAAFMTPPDRDHPSSYLTRFSMVKTRLTVEDRVLQRTWRVPATEMRLWRQATGIGGSASFELEAGDRPARVKASGSYHMDARRVDLDVDFFDVVPAEYAQVLPRMADLSAVEVPFEGTLRIAMSVDGELANLAFDVKGSRGRLRLPDPLAQWLGVAGLNARGRYQGGSQVLEIEEIVVDAGAGGTLRLPPQGYAIPLEKVRARGRYFRKERRLEVDALKMETGGPVAAVNARVEGVGGDLTIMADASLDRATVDDFPRYWPKGWAGDTRKWVLANLSDGVATDVHATIHLRRDGDGSFDVLSIKGGFGLEDLTIDYLAPMPKVRKVFAAAKFDETRIDFALNGAAAGGLAVEGGTIEVTGLDEHDQFLELHLRISGPFRDAMRLVDHAPLGLARAVGIDAVQTWGSAATRLNMRFILEKDLTFERVEVRAQSKLTDIGLPGALFGRDISSGRFVLDADKRGMDVKGGAMLSEIPVTLAWRENFAATAPFRRRYELTGTIEDIHKLGDLGPDMVLPPPDIASGAVKVDARFTEIDGVKGRFEAKLDLSGLDLAVPVLRWRKPADVPGSAEVTVNLRRGRVADIPGFTVSTGGMTARGAARFAVDGGGLERVLIDRLAYGRTDVAGEIRARPGGGWDTNFQGAEFDLSPMIDDLLEAGTAEAGPEFDLVAAIDRVWVGEEQYIGKVAATLSHDGFSWRAVRLRARDASDKAFELDIEPKEGGKRGLLIRADDAGTFLRTLGYYDDMLGGNLLLTGEFDGRGAEEMLVGRLKVISYRVVKAPLLTRLLSIMALTGIIDALQGEGLGFASLEVPFTFEDGVLVITNSKATGASIGFTASGKIYTEAELIHLEGTVVPAYLINAALGSIPIVGKLFTGGEEGGGVFAARYLLTGSLEDPKVSMNPLSVVAPGFLRNIFGVPDADSAPPEPTIGTNPSELGR